MSDAAKILLSGLWAVNFDKHSQRVTIDECPDVTSNKVIKLDRIVGRDWLSKWITEGCYGRAGKDRWVFNTDYFNKEDYLRIVR